ncbi:MAG: bifunctional riboflavin kinase/FAD synthetase [Fuerstiella sp.]
MTWSGLNVPPSAKGGIVTIGNFDGVHRGHQAMLTAVRGCALDASSPVVVVTFDPHPVNILRPQIELPRLSSLKTRTELLKRFGADEVVVLHVDNDLLGMDPQTFFKQVVIHQLEATGVVEGPDFRFGKDRLGDTTVLKQLCEQNGLRLQVISAVRHDAEMISSTRIRSLISGGRLIDAVNLLGHSYTITGQVSHGAGRGTTLGIPTANLESIAELLPADGVYAGRCVLNGKPYACAVNIGPNPTFNDSTRKLECHVIDFAGDIYGQAMAVDLLSELRELHSFDSQEALVTQINHDVLRCRQIFAASEI